MDRESVDILKEIMGSVGGRGVTKREVDVVVREALESVPKLSDMSCLPQEDHDRLSELHDAVANNRPLSADDAKFLWSTAWHLKGEEKRLRDKVDQTIAYMINRTRERVTFRM